MSTVNPTGLTPGERVRITLDATVVRWDQHLRCFRVAGSDEGEQRRIWLAPDALSRAHIERLDPPDGVPQPGDLWRDSEGALRVAVAVGLRRIDLVNVHTGSGSPWRDVYANGPLTLVHRPEES